MGEEVGRGRGLDDLCDGGLGGDVGLGPREVVVVHLALAGHDGGGGLAALQRTRELEVRLVAGAVRAEEELRQPPPVRILRQVQQRRPVWKDVPPSTSAMRAMSQNQKEDEGSSSSRRTPFVKNFSKGFSVSKTQRRMVLWKRSKFGTQNQTL